MAIYHCRIKVHSRGQGAKAASASAYRSGTRVRGRSTSAVRAAAYRAGGVLIDPDGEVHDFSRKHGVVWNGILAPENAPAWVYDREELWNAVEKAEKRKDAQLFREAELTIPRELTPAQRKALVLNFVQAQFIENGMIADIGIHCPKASDGGDNCHAHVMLSLRKITENGFGNKNRDWNGADFKFAKDSKRDRDGVSVKAEPGGLVNSTREAWQNACNKALEDAGSAARVDHRSLRAQGKRVVRLPFIGPAIHVAKPDTANARRLDDRSRAYLQRRAQQAIQAVIREAKAVIQRPPVLRTANDGDPHQQRVAGMRHAVHEVTRLNGRRLARDGIKWAEQLADDLHGVAPQSPSLPDAGGGHDR